MTNMTTMHDALEGLRVGDAFGFKLSIRPQHVARRELPEAPWHWSDDTAMATSLAAVLLAHGEVEQDALFAQFVWRYKGDPRRGYGPGMKRLLEKTEPGDWREATPALFKGSGSFGNGAAMRAPVLGAYFAGHELEYIITQAESSARVTHAHPEGVAGAVAITCATAIKATQPDIAAQDFLDTVAHHTPDGLVRQGLKRALDFDVSELAQAVEVLGNGQRISAPDTVPFCVWWAAHAPNSFEEAMWTLVGVGGDEDTNCAIVGGILGAAGILPPETWSNATEAHPPLSLLPPWKDPFAT